MSNKTSDKNVENIEIVIKDCREHLKLYGEAFITADELDRIENILAEREQDKKRIQELEEESRKKSIELICYQEELENSILKQVVIDVIQEYKNKVERYNEYRIQGKETDVEYYENITNTAIVQVLQRILEGEK